MNNAHEPASEKTDGAADASGSSVPPRNEVADAADAADAALVEKASGGSAEAFEELFVKYRQRVFAVAWRLLRNEDSALDVVQDAFVRAYEQLDSLRGDTRFYPWLRRIAVNLSIDRLRHIRRGVEVPLDEHRVSGRAESASGSGIVNVARSSAEGPAVQAETAEFSAALSDALLKLSDSHRAVFMLHAAEGMSYKEIAEALEVNIGTVMSRLFYARKRLQELLAPHLKDRGMAGDE